MPSAHADATVAATAATDRASDPSGARVLAVDGNSLGHRAWHSSRDDDPGDGTPVTTGAVVSMLATAWTYGPYDAVVVGFDHAVNRRRLEEPGYKAGRPPTPPELTAALQLLREHLAQLGFQVEERHGAEADDLLAATAWACEDRGWRCDLLSSDRDLTACVGPTTRLLRPRARFADLAVEDEATVQATYGIPPHAYTDLAALRGDPSDGLAGATGIGPKIAARLLRDHGSVAALYDVLHDLPPRVEASLRASRDRVERNLLLMAPIPHLEVDVASAVARGIDVDTAADVLRSLGLEAAARRLVRAVTDPPTRPPQPPPPDDTDDPGTQPSSAPPPALVRAGAAVVDAEQGALF